MKIGVMSDIHSNILAFEACVRYLEKEGCDEYIFLGDYVSDTPYTRETLDLLYDHIGKYPSRLLKGNREEYMLAQRRAIADNDKEQIWTYNSASGNLLYTYEQLTPEDLDFFEKLPVTFEYNVPGHPSVRCCHGSPASTRELVQLDSDKARNWLERISEDYMLCAHTHFPGEYSYRGKHYYNSGCIGISIGDPGYAQCMILKDEESDGRIIWRPEFLRIPYDNRKVVSDMFTSGLSKKAPWFINSNIQILLTGTDNSAKLVEKAAELSRAADEKRGWPFIKEKYFEEAARKVGVPDYRKYENDPQMLYKI